MTSEVAICNPCKGLDNCQKYCPVRAGENIVTFVNNISKNNVETQIGEFKQDTLGGKLKSLVILGYMIEKGCSPTNTLKILPDEGISIKTKFTDCWGMTPTQILRAYTVYANKPKNIQVKATDDLKKIMGPTIVPIITNIGSDIEINVVDFGGRNKKVMTTIKSMKWTLDTSDGEVKGVIFAEAGKLEDGSNIAKLNMRDYGKTWTLPNLERTLKTSEITREAIQMYDIGLIAPLEVKSSKSLFAVDNSHLYHVKSDAIYVIGKWNNNSEIDLVSGLNKNIENDSAFKKIQSYLKFVSKHKRFIVPYGLGKANRIEVK